MKVKFKITYEWEDEQDFNDDSLGISSEEQREVYNECMIDDYSALTERAFNILPGCEKAELLIEYEDGRKTKLITE